MNNIVNGLLQQNNMTMYKLHKESRIPKATLSDICSGKTMLTKCSAETLYKLSKALNVSMEFLLEAAMQNQERRSSFETYRSNLCHYLKDLGDIQFLIETLENDTVRRLYDKRWYPEALYLLAMIDYLSDEHKFEQCENYNDIRKTKLKNAIYPKSVMMLDYLFNQQNEKEYCEEHAIPQFKRFNIYEMSIRDVR